MTIPNSGEAIGNLLRLGSLKNVSGRKKILPGAQFLQDLEYIPSEVRDTSQENLPEMNFPQPETGGELTTQSYDIRANNVIEPENFWKRFGKSLAMQSQMGRLPPNKSPDAPPIETQQVEMEEGLPPVSAEQQEKGFGEKFKNLVKEASPLMPSFAPGIENAGNAFQKIANAFKPQIAPEFAEQFPEIQKKLTAPENVQAEQPQETEIEKAQQEPWTRAAYGATDIFANSPESKKEFQTYTGIDFTPQMEEATKKYEKVIADLENGLNEDEKGYDDQARRIKDRILRNEANDADKFYIGLALAMPLLIGGIYGTEAALGALGGGAQGLANAFTQREKNIARDEELLSDINKEKTKIGQRRGELELEKLKIPQSIANLLPKDEREFLKGKKVVINHESGQIEGIQIDPGFVARPDQVTSQKGLERMEKRADEIKPTKQFVLEINKLTDEIIDLASQIDNQTVLSKVFNTISGSKIPQGTLAKTTPDVIFEGRKVNSGTLLENKLGLLANAYAQAKKLGQLDRAAQEHMNKLVTNPTKSFISGKDAIEQILSIRDIAQEGLINSYRINGFAEDPLYEELGKENRKLYGRLNQKENEKRSSELLKE